MEIIETGLKDCFIIKSKAFGDDRGFFLESFHQKKLSNLGVSIEVKQVNFAKSQRNVLRGLHFQTPPFEQAKLVGVISGAVLDVVVDLRPESPTFLGSYSIELNSPDTLFYVPRGFAHGYLTRADDTIFHYAVDNFYSPEHESGVRFDDPDLKIDWGNLSDVIVSPKDLRQPLFRELSLG